MDALDAKQIIQSTADKLATVCLESHGTHFEYSDEDLFNAAAIFSHFLMDKIYSENKEKMPQEAMERLARNTGDALRALIFSATDKDMHKVAAKLFKKS